jgi:hypothetical protein
MSFARIQAYLVHDSRPCRLPVRGDLDLLEAMLAGPVLGRVDRYDKVARLIRLAASASERSNQFMSNKKVSKHLQAVIVICHLRVIKSPVKASHGCHRMGWPQRNRARWGNRVRESGVCVFAREGKGVPLMTVRAFAIAVRLLPAGTTGSLRSRGLERPGSVDDTSRWVGKELE